MTNKVVKITDHLKKKTKRSKEELRKKIAEKLKEAKEVLENGK